MNNYRSVRPVTRADIRNANQAIVHGIKIVLSEEQQSLYDKIIRSIPNTKKIIRDCNKMIMVK